MKKNKVKGYLKKFMLAGVMISVLASFASCKLAKEEENADEIFGDKMVGCYITTEPIGNGKIYAKFVEKEEDGVKHAEYVFEDYDGIEFYATTIMATEEMLSDYDIASYGDEVSEAHTAWLTNENTGTKSEELSGTIYYTERLIFYMNPVYQEKDGDVYMYAAEIGELVSTNDGGELTSTISENATYTEDDEKISESTKVSVTYSYKQQPKQIKFIYMNNENTVISEEEYEPGKVPNEINVSEEVDYILVESYGFDVGKNKDIIVREIYDEDYDDKYIHTFMDDGRGFCVKFPTEIIWE